MREKVCKAFFTNTGERLKITNYKDNAYLTELIDDITDKIKINVRLKTNGKFKKSVKLIKLLLGAFIGSIYVVSVFFIHIDLLYTPAFKFFLSLMIIAATFKIDKIKEFLRVLCVFYLVSFTFGGAAFGLFYMQDMRRLGGFIMDGGILLINFPYKILIISFVVSYILITISVKIFSKRITPEKLFIDLEVFFDSKSISVSALIDTGNSLLDPVSNTPVIIVELSKVKALMPTPLLEIFENLNKNDFLPIANALLSSKWGNRFLLIPFKSLGKEDGLLVGFKPDEVQILKGENKKEISSSIIGIYDKKLSCDESYAALISPEEIGF